MSLNDILATAARYDDHVMAERVVNLAVEHNIRFGGLSLDVSKALTNASENDSIDTVNLLLRFISKQDVTFFSWDIASMLETAAKHSSSDIAEQVLKIAVEQDISLSSRDIASMLETAAKFERDDILKLVDELARKNGIDPDDVYGFGRAGYQPVDDYAGDPYEVLGVSEDTLPEDIRQAFRTLIKQYHPDKNPGDKIAEEKAREIISAYSKLRDMGKAD